jgi:uncharacterized protein (TIGR00266 family)
MPGGILRVDLKDEALVLRAGAWLGSAPEIRMEAQGGNVHSVVGSLGMFLLRLVGEGPVLLGGCFGSIMVLDLFDQEVLVDNGHLLGWTEGLSYSLRKTGSLFTAFASGEGLLCQFGGTGNVFVSTRDINEFGVAIGRHLPEKKAVRGKKK